MKAARDPLDGRIAVFTWLAAATLWVEALLTAFWPALTVAGGFATLALFGIFALLPPIAHLCLLILFAAGLGVMIWRGVRGLRAPSTGAAMRRLERDSALGHRPFQSLGDRPVGDDPVARSLWRIHLDRRRAGIDRLRVAAPTTRIAERDPRAIRLLVVIALAVGLLVAGPRAGRVLLTALTPDISSPSAALPVEAWIKPPAYTGLPPILLTAMLNQTVEVPTGSMIEAHVTGGSHTPRLLLDGARSDFRPVDGGGFAISQALTAPGRLSIRQGWSSLAQWTIDIIPDQPPVVAFAESPAPMDSGALRIAYRATDDYGVASVALRARLAPGGRDTPAEPIAIDLAASRTGRELRGVSFQDLTAHPWAGMKVVARLVATDVAGQPGESEEIVLTLPERSFTNPAARTIIAARKHVILGDAPRFQAAMQLNNLLQDPTPYHGDFAVYLALRAAIDELRTVAADPIGQTAMIEDLLWSAAVRIEDGDRPEAEKAMRAAEDALEKALKDPSTPASEIARLTQNLKEAMDRDLNAMMEKMREQQGQDGQSQSAQAGANSQAVDRKDLDKQLDKMAQMAEMGSRDAAQDMLDYIKSLLENLRAGKAPSQANQQAMKSLQDLKDLAKKQRDIEDQTDADAAKSQESLRQSLGDAARDIGDSMGDIPQSLSGADKAMRNATKALQRGAKGGAKADQEEAASQLDQAAQALSEQLSDQGQSERKGDGKGNRDPFGRARFDSGKDVKVPTDREMQRSREILDELRRRAGEHDRPRFELDYLRRLLQQF